jgi:CheY-like chemotaxis protein
MGKTILLVEDSEPAIIQIKDLLSECGYRMLIARNGSEAFGIIEVVTPDAIILDLMMPEVDGFEVLGALREAETTAYIPVLILTAKQITKEELRFLKRNNVHQLIQKGDVNRQGLKDAVAAMLDSSGMDKDSTPLSPASAPLPPSISSPQPPFPSRKPKILVVEDNPDNMTTVKALLADEYEVIGATDGLQGVVLAKSQLPDLILMDIELPGMNGIEAFTRIRKAPETQHIPVLALTASAMVADRETILSHGFDAFIAKPIIHDSFHKILKEVLDGR